MTTTTQALLTADEFMRLYGGEPSTELVNGHVVRYPVPGCPHGYVVNNVSCILTPFVKANDLGRVFSCDTLIRTKAAPETLRGADVAFVSYKRLPKGPIPEGPLTVPPELVVEVRSPSDRLSVVTAKAEEYIDAGVQVVVYLDPRNESAAVYSGDDFPQRLHNGDELTLPDLLPGFAVPVKQYFA